MLKRQSNNPKRRVADAGTISEETLSNLAKARYTGSAHHKTKPADYGFTPPVNPRRDPANPKRDKSVCDGKRVILWEEAKQLFRSGVTAGMVSSHIQDGLPKYVWAVDGDGEVYEAKLGGDGTNYHGYRLSYKDDLRKHLAAEWRKRTG